MYTAVLCCIQMQLQEIHDQLMREGIAKHGGYEIATEGDSFQVAFASCQAAMSFCTSMQYRLLEQSWPRRVISLGGCKAVRGEQLVTPDTAVKKNCAFVLCGRAIYLCKMCTALPCNCALTMVYVHCVCADYDSQQLMFAGPRVRMGVHFAQRGSFAMKVHNLTRHKVFAGPAIQIVADISDIAHGGQIVLTEVRGGACCCDRTHQLLARQPPRLNVPAVHCFAAAKHDPVEAPHRSDGEWRKSAMVSAWLQKCLLCLTKHNQLAHIPC